MSPWVEIGFVLKAHGLRGQLVLVLHNPQSDLLQPGITLKIGGGSYEVGTAKKVEKGTLVSLTDVHNRDEAEALKGETVLATRDSLQSDGELLLGDLVGCSVKTVDGRILGEVFAIEVGAQDRLVVALENDQEMMIPCVDEFVRDVQVDRKQIIVAVPDGMPMNPKRRVH